MLISTIHVKFSRLPMESAVANSADQRLRGSPGVQADVRQQARRCEFSPHGLLKFKMHNKCTSSHVVLVMSDSF